MLRRIFGPERDEVTGELRRLHEEEHNDLYSSPNIILVIKLGLIRLVGHVEGMGATGKVHLAFWCGNLRQIDNLEIKINLQQVMWGAWTSS
jgi:hypothetical protein